MKYRIAPLLLVAALAGCGDGADFAIKVDRAPNVVVSELSKINPNALTTAAGLRPISTSRPDDNSLLYTLPAAGGHDEGIVLLSTRAGDGNSSVVEVTVDLPYITRDTPGGAQFLDEAAIERELKKSLKSWGRTMGAGGSTHGAVADTSQMISLAGVGLQDFDKFEETAQSALMSELLASADNAPTGDWGDSGDSWGSDTDSSYSEPSYNDDAYVDDGYAGDDYGEGGGWGDGA